jgi:hypothetical protein
LNKYFKIYVPYDASSWKVKCPWAMEHEDGGLDKQFRIYSESNSGYCFAMHGRVDNIRLYRETHDYMTEFEAAKELLDEYGIEYKRKSYQETFAEVSKASSQRFDYQDLVDAMKFYLQSFDAYSDVEYDTEVVNWVEAFNQEARIVCARSTELKEVEQWYSRQKEDIKRFLSSLLG